MNARCDECAFHEPAVMDEGPVIECRRYPPIVTADASNDQPMVQAWPQMSATDWCGEFSPRITQETETP
jgi:hypothetical protein